MLLRIRFQQVASPESENDVVWSWGFAGGAIPQPALDDAAEVILDSLDVNQSSGEDVAGYLQPLNPLYAEAFHNGGGPAVSVVDLSARPNVGSGGAGPSEVQLVVSRLVATPRGPSPIGRLYVGPLGGAALDAVRPSLPGICTTITEWAWMLHQSFLAIGLSPVVLRGMAGAGPVTEVPIVGYRADNAWDTQRRRGLQPTGHILRPAA